MPMQKSRLTSASCKLEATKLKATYSRQVPPCAKTERGNSQTSTVHKISITKTSNNSSNYVPFSSTWMSLQNKIHSHCQNLVSELSFSVRKLFQAHLSYKQVPQDKKKWLLFCNIQSRKFGTNTSTRTATTDKCCHIPQLHIALHVCCTQQWKSMKQIQFPVP